LGSRGGQRGEFGGEGEGEVRNATVRRERACNKEKLMVDVPGKESVE